MADTEVIWARVPPEAKARLVELARLAERSLSDTLRLLIMAARPADLVPTGLREEGKDE